MVMVIFKKFDFADIKVVKNNQNLFVFVILP
jgi:hypothetical protein